MKKAKPNIFISSTIYDFRDLRESLRFWLEEHGYQVFLSEANDFPQRPSANSYQSCLDAIEKCNFFILLIGSRVGGMISDKENISITRMEYRYAYEKMKEGQIEILPFIREDVWNCRSDRKSLKKHLIESDAIQKELTTEEIESIWLHPSNYVNDAKHIFAFIDEVIRKKEMIDCQNTSQPLPGGNWIYQFKSFRDIVRALRVVLDFSGNLRRKALSVNLKYEIKHNLKELLRPKKAGSIEPVTEWSSFARRAFTGDINEYSKYLGKHLIWLGFFLVGFGRIKLHLLDTALTEAIVSGEFLEYQKETDQYEVSDIQNQMLLLRENIDYIRCYDMKAIQKLQFSILDSKQIKNNRDTEFTRPNIEMLFAFACHDRIENIIEISKSIYLTLSGKPKLRYELNLKDTCPLPLEQTQIEKETPSEEQIIAWLET